MEIITLQQRISKYLNELYDLLEMQNSDGNYSLNKASENIFKDILNILFDYALINTNLLNSNYPSIDLVSANESRVCYQVSVTKDIKKIKDTLNVFFEKHLYKEYDRIYFIILKSARNYNRSLFAEFVSPLLVQYKVSNFKFDTKEHVIDSSYMYRMIANLSDSDKLIRIHTLLSEYSSGKKFESNLSKYYETLKEDYYEVVMEDVKGMTLNDIYIDPEFQFYYPQILENVRQHGISVIRDFIDLKRQERQIIESFLYGDVFHLSSIFQRPNATVLFLLGYPGQGKTSFCKNVIVQHFRKQNSIPLFYLKLRNVHNTRALIDNPFKVIQEELEEEIDQEIDKKLLKKSIIILDGLDELYMKDNLKADDIERFCKELIRESVRLKYYKIIVTTRYGYIDLRRIYEDGYIALSLKPLSLKKQIEWLEKYQLFHPETHLTDERLKKFNDKNSDLVYIKELINQPLLLYIIASLNVDLDSDTDRSEIYNLLFEQIIERKYSKDGQIEILKHLTKEDLRALLHEIAFLIFTSGKEYVTEEQLLSASTIREYTSKISNNNLSGTLKGVLVSFYFKESKIKGKGGKSEMGIEFLHKSLQEYLAAEKIVEALFNDLLDKDRKDKYIIKSDSTMLEWLNNLFGEQPLTREIEGYINDITFKKSVNEKAELASRITEYLSYFLEKDFLYKYESSDKSPMEKILTIFQSYWFILFTLKQRKNYLISLKIISKVVFYFNTIAANRGRKYGIYISNQIIENASVNFLESVEEFLNNIIFYSCDIQGEHFMFKTLYGVNFDGCSLNNTDWFESTLEKCHFEDCEFSSIEIFKTKFLDVHFKNCTITRLRFYNDDIQFARSRKLLFTNVTFDKNSFDIFSHKKFNSKFKNCKIQLGDKEFKEIEDTTK